MGHWDLLCDISWKFASCGPAMAASFGGAFTLPNFHVILFLTNKPQT